MLPERPDWIVILLLSSLFIILSFVILLLLSSLVMFARQSIQLTIFIVGEDDLGRKLVLG